MLNPNEIMKTELEEAKNNAKIRKIENKSEGRLKFDINQFQLISLSYPVESKDPKTKRRFIIEIRYSKKGEFKKFRNKLVMFGYRNMKEYIDDQDENRRLIRIASLKHTENIFEPNHWRLMLLNREKTLLEAYNRYLKDSNLAK